MAAEIEFRSLDSKGEEMLDQLEHKTGERGERGPNGARAYSLLGAGVGTDGFDAMLDKIDSSWANHLNRTP